METTLTFTGENPSQFVRDVAESFDSLSVREHHSFVELPGQGYKARAFDPRAGYFGSSYADYAAGLSEPLDQHIIHRHRLQKKDPTAAISEPVKPIVYYLDRGFPSQCAARSSMAHGGGTRRLKRQGTRTPFAWNCFRKTPIRWTSGTT